MSSSHDKFNLIFRINGDSVVMEMDGCDCEFGKHPAMYDLDDRQIDVLKSVVRLIQFNNGD